MPSMNFLLTGQDALSRVFDRVGDSANRLHRRISAATTNSDAAVRRFTNNATRHLAGLQRDSDAGGKALEELGKVTRLIAPAAIPAAASLAPIAAGAGTVAVAMAAMGAALGPQISALGEASDAQEKYEEAVAKSGARSQEAVKAQTDYAQAMAKLPPATREAAVAVGMLKDNYKAWSDSLAGDTMAPFTKGIAVTNALLPKTTGLVKAASGEADRFVTIIGGGMASPGLDRLNSKFTAFAEKTLRRVNDEIVHLLRVGGSGEVGGSAREFMDWARAQGPTVAAVLSSVATALLHVLQAGSEVGVGLLQAVEAIARLVSAVPPDVIATFLQLAIALKLTKAAALGLVAARSALAGFGLSLVAMNTAAAAAPGRLAAVRAAIAALSRTTKIAMAGTGIGLAILAISELMERSRNAPPDVDKLTSSLKRLGSEGKATGEAAKHFGADLDGLYGKVRSLTDPSTADKVQQFLVGWTGWDSTPVKEAKENLDSVDKALAGLVQNGQSDLAAEALKRLTAEYGKGGRDTRQFTKELNDYKSAVADAKFEQELAAQSMGLFGTQAQQVQAKLDAQKRSTDGLRQSIQALNEANRAGLGGMIGFEAAIDAAAKAAQENAGALDMSGGKLNLNGEKARTAATALQDLASKTDEAAASARESGASWETVNGIYSRGREQFIKSAQAMGLSKREAQQLAKQLLDIPSKKSTTLEMRTEDAISGLNGVIAAMKKTPGSKSVKVEALTKDAVALLRDLGFKVKQMPDGRFKVTAETANAKANISAVQRARDGLKDKSITLSARDRASAAAAAIKRHLDSLQSKSITITTTRVYHAIYNTTGRPAQGEGGVSKYAGGGTPEAGEMAMVGENGPELVLFGEAARVIDATKTKAIMSGTLGAGRAAAQGLAAGLGSTRGVYAASRSMAAAVTAGIRDELEIASPSKKTKALAKDVGKGFIQGLTGSRDKIKSVAADLAKDIKTAFTGKKESNLLKMVDKQTKRLLDAAAKRDKIAAKIAEAKAYAADVTKGARESAGLSNLGMEPEQVTAGGIKAGLAKKLAQIKSFSKFVEVLAKRGLNKGLIRQILNMGPEAGYAYANALAGADKSTIASINKTQSAIDKESAKLGNKGADILYDSGRNAGKGFLTGLTSQKKAIENLMMDIAKGMQTAIKKALGIKSPSTVMARLGVFSTEGLARGLVDGMPGLDRSLAAVSGRVAAVQPVLGRPAVAAGRGGASPIVINIDGALDPSGVARQVRTMLLTLKRDLGGGDLGIA